MRTTRLAAAAALALAGSLALTGCGGDDEPADAPTTEQTIDATDVTDDATDDAGGTEGTTTQDATDDAEPTDDATRAAVGELVEDFPADVVPLPEGAQITLSSVVEGDGVLEVSLAGESELPADGILEFYRDALVAQDFTEVDGALPEGAVGATFGRGDGTELLTVSVVPVEGLQRFTVGGIIATG